MTPWTVAYQAPPSMGFSRQEYWSGLPFPSPACSLDLTENSQCGDRGHTYRNRFILAVTILLYEIKYLLKSLWGYRKSLGYNIWIILCARWFTCNHEINPKQNLSWGFPVENPLLGVACHFTEPSLMFFLCLIPHFPPRELWGQAAACDLSLAQRWALGFFPGN